jgi:hypothetical protein
VVHVLPANLLGTRSTQFWPGYQWDLQITSDGRCLAYWEQDESGVLTLVPLGVETGRTTDLGTLDPALGEGSRAHAASWFQASHRDHDFSYY